MKEREELRGKDRVTVVEKDSHELSVQEQLLDLWKRVKALEAQQSKRGG